MLIIYLLTISDGRFMVEASKSPWFQLPSHKVEANACITQIHWYDLFINYEMIIGTTIIHCITQFFSTVCCCLWCENMILTEHYHKYSTMPPLKLSSVHYGLVDIDIIASEAHKIPKKTAKICLNKYVNLGYSCRPQIF